jgi:tetratricopeptide (TPR) repeat protein
MPWFNLSAIYYNQKKSDDALAACEHTLSSDPTLADAHYLRGIILFGRGKAEQGRYTVPPGTVESLNSYLQFAPQGEYVNTVRAMIARINAPVESSWRPAKK